MIAAFEVSVCRVQYWRAVVSMAAPADGRGPLCVTRIVLSAPEVVDEGRDAEERFRVDVGGVIQLWSHLAAFSTS
jgi:hypothetical protein